MNYRLTQHARNRMEQAEISEELVRLTLQEPEGRIWDESSKYIYQRLFQRANGKAFMLRAVVDEAQIPASVVTVYAASRFYRYLK
jgi:hypothetical protein